MKVKTYIDENATVLEAMSAINKNGLKTIFILEDGKLKGSVSDGDTRRWIVNGGDVEASVTNIINYSPKYILNTSKENPIEFLRKNRIEAVPIVNDELELLDIVAWGDKTARENRDKIEIPVVMMAGGKGTRLFPYTKILPKPLIPVGEYPVAQIILDEFRKYKCDEFFMIVNHKKNMIKAYFNEHKKKYNITYIDEDTPLGTGGGLSLLRGKIKETFILTNCDILVTADISKIYAEHRKNGNKITMVCCNKVIEIPYGVVNIDDDNQIKAMVEKPQLPFLTNTGLYIVEPDVIDRIEDDCVIGFPDVIKMLKENGDRVGVYSVEEDEWLDMGQPEELDRMRQYIERL